MDNKFDKKSLSDIAMTIDWDSISPSVSKMANSPTNYLCMAVSSMERRLREYLAGFDLTHTQLTVLMSLMILTKNGNTVTQRDMAIFLNMDKTMVSEVLRTLERKGYIVRKNHPNDNRAKSLIVTDKGLDITDVAANRAVEFNDNFFSALGDEKGDFVRMLKKLI